MKGSIAAVGSLVLVASASAGEEYPDYRTSLDVTLLAIGGSALVAGAFVPADVREVPLEGLDPTEIGWGIDRRIVGQTDLGADSASDLTRNLAIAMPIVLAAVTLPSEDRWSNLGRRTLVYLEAAMITSGITTVGK
ncbi:MAG: hypothetical protein ACRDGR_08875, partial [bacterium]